MRGSFDPLHLIISCDDDGGGGVDDASSKDHHNNCVASKHSMMDSLSNKPHSNIQDHTKYPNNIRPHSKQVQAQALRLLLP